MDTQQYKQHQHFEKTPSSLAKNLRHGEPQDAFMHLKFIMIVDIIINQYISFKKKLQKNSLEKLATLKYLLLGEVLRRRPIGSQGAQIQVENQ